MQLGISWYDIVRSFKKKVEENVNSLTHRRVLFDTTNILVDGMKMKWINILLLDTLLTVFNLSDADFTLFELNRRRKFDQYNILTTSIIECCSRAYLAEAVKDLGVKLSSHISIVDFFDEWTDINTFVRIESLDRSNRSWKRRILASEMMKNILEDKRMTLPMLICVVVGRIYNDKFLHKYYVIPGELFALNTPKPLISTNQIGRFQQLLNTVETLEEYNTDNNMKRVKSLNEMDCDNNSDSDNLANNSLLGLSIAHIPFDINSSSNNSSQSEMLQSP